MSVLKQQISFSSNFASIFSIMRYNSSVLFSWNLIHFQQKEPMMVQIWWNRKSGTLMSSLRQNNIKFQLKKVQKSYLSWTKFKGKVTCSFTYDMKNFVNFHPTTHKFQNFISMCYFCPKYMRFELKNTEELSFMTLNSDAKFE